MNHQMTLEEFGISLKEDPGSAQKRIHEKIYAFPCGGCICNHCANSVECLDSSTGEAEFGCFTCDDCKNYGGKGAYRDNWRTGCARYKGTEAHADRTRKNFRLLNTEKIREEREKYGNGKQLCSKWYSGVQSVQS